MWGPRFSADSRKRRAAPTNNDDDDDDDDGQRLAAEGYCTASVGDVRLLTPSAVALSPKRGRLETGGRSGRFVDH